MRRAFDYFFAVLLSALVVVVLVVVGNVQANQYRKVVNHIDSTGRAVLCVLQIEPAKRTPALIHQCVERAQP